MKLVGMAIGLFIVMLPNAYAVTPEVEDLLDSVLPRPTIVQFTASPNEVIAGDLALLVWEVDDATSVTIEPGIGEVENSGSISIRPGETTQYVLTATNLVRERSAETSIIVKDPFIVGIDVQPDEGDTSQLFRFKPVVDSAETIQNYAWDFDGDGQFDRHDAVGLGQGHVYSEPGSYTATLEVTDNSGNTRSTSKQINVINAPSDVLVYVNTNSGTAPLRLTFRVVAEDHHRIQEVSIDVDGDGVYDQIANPSRTAVFYHTYTQPGLYQASVKVIDQIGGETIVAKPFMQIQVGEADDLDLSLSVSPNIGPAPLLVNFNASASANDDSEISTWAWDLDGDGNVDQIDDSNGGSSSSTTTSHTYDTGGVFYPSLMVTTTSGKSARIVGAVSSELGVSLSVSNDTISTELNQSATVDTQLNGNTTVHLWLEDRTGERIRTLVDGEQRASGSYSDAWDGRDEDSQVVPEGDYYAVLQYETGSGQQILDLRHTTGGERYNPQRSKLPSRFQPYASNPLAVDYQLPRASEVTAFMGLYRNNVRLVTFHQRQLQGTGTHRVLWHGEDDRGQLIELPQSESFLFGIWAFELADNAIFVQNAPRITQLAARPAILSPSDELSSVTFNLSKPAASLELVVTDAERGINVSRRYFTQLPAGENTVTWDGKISDEEFVPPGSYRIGIRATAADGTRSLMMYTLQRVYY